MRVIQAPQGVLLTLDFHLIQFFGKNYYFKPQITATVKYLLTHISIKSNREYCIILTI